MPRYNYESTDTGLTGVTGQAGAWISRLDAVLVNGFNSLSGVTITRSGSTATATYTAHGYRNGQVLLMAGASQTEYNGLFTISGVTANTFQYTVTGSPASPATGTITSKVAPAGWTKAYSGKNLAAYLAPGGGCYYRVDDTGTTSARIIGYKTMSDVNTGADPFPTNVQVSGGLYLVKSNTADATARAWGMVISNGGKMVFGRVERTSVSAASSLFNFGEFISRKSGDVYNWLIRCSTSATASNDVNDNSLGGNSISGQGGFFICRSYTQIGTAVQAFQVGDGLIAASIFGSAGFTFPNPVDGGLDMVDCRIMESTTLHRGWTGASGAYMPSHNKPLTHLATFDGSGTYAGRTFVAWNFGNSSNGQIFIETTP